MLVMKTPNTITVGAERPQESSLRSIFVNAKHPAAIVRGATVLDVNQPGREHEADFARYAAMTTPRAAEVTHAISPATNEIVMGAQDFEGDNDEPAPTPAPKKRASKKEPLCERCGEEPRAKANALTRPEEITWGARCRKATCERRRKDAAKPAAAPAKRTKKTPKKVASKAPAKRRSTDPGEILVEVLAGLRGDQITEERVREIVNDALNSVLGTAVREIVREELATIFASLRGRT